MCMCEHRLNLTIILSPPLDEDAAQAAHSRFRQLVNGAARGALRLFVLASGAD